MQAYHQPQPQRFAVFTQLANGKGFRIKNSPYIYMFDKYGGWYDQYNNYYGPDGHAQEPPQDQDYDFQRVINQEEDDEDDYYQKEYGTTNYHEDEEDEEHMPSNDQIRTELAISRNLQTLGDYPLKMPLRVDFSNMNFRLTKEDLLKHYKSKVKGILNVILIKKEGRFNGEGYIVVEDVNAAQKIVKLQAEEVSGRKIFYDIQGFQDYLMDKITKDQMGSHVVNQDDFQPLIKEIKQIEISEDKQKLIKKKYLTKQSKTQQQQKQPEARRQVKQVPKNIISWSLYQGDFYMFPAKNSFCDWAKSMGFIQNQHFMNIITVNSTDSNKRIKRLSIRSDMFQKVQGSLYDSKKFYLQKVN